MTCLHCYLPKTLYFFFFNKERFMSVPGAIKGFFQRCMTVAAGGSRIILAEHRQSPGATSGDAESLFWDRFNPVVTLEFSRPWAWVVTS